MASVGRNYATPNNPCLDAELIPLTSHKSVLKSAIEVSKIAVIMTDGEFNTSYCNGVIAKNSGNGSGSADDKIDCNATNGGATAQAKQLCTAIKAKGIAVYTIGFDVEDDETAIEVMTDCATSANHAYLAATDAELQTAP